MSKRLLPPVLVMLLGVAMVAWFMCSPYWQAMQRVGTVMRLVNKYYIDAERADFDRLADAAVRGMMSSLDSYSQFLAPEELTRFEESTQQRFVGIGVEIEQVGSRVLIMTVFQGGPAHRAGLLPGDHIVRVEDQDSSSWSVVQLSGHLRGVAGTEVDIAVRREGVADPIDFTLQRAAVRTPSVEGLQMLDDRIGYLRLRQFGERTVHEMELALATLRGMGMQALILDLRGNPGGLLTASKDVAGLFLHRGALIVYTSGRDESNRREFINTLSSPDIELPLVLLVNEGSASGSEIVAGALQEAERAVVVGTTTHGKGSIQSVFAFRSGGAIRQTTARYRLASGRSIDQEGIVPDVVVEQAQQDRVRLRLQERHLPNMDKAKFEELFGFTPDLTDEPLKNAKEILLSGLSSARTWD
ncbi:MAG: S41 family peptidase [Verrucomicrobia bacterium]|nr:S41 family peptidase [Verrucomicrobiota bacterium]